MKRHCLIVALAIAISIQSKAQGRLSQLGAPANYEIVQRPLLYFDIMRTQLPSWVRSFKQSSSDNWEQINMVVNKTDANGKLTNLSFFSYDANESKWVTRSIHLYEYAVLGNNIVSEKRTSWLNDGTDIIIRDISDSFVFEQTKLVKRLQSISYGTTFNQELEMFNNYDINGRLLFDSVSISVNSNQYSRTGDYYYNNNNQCIKYVTKIGNDTSYYYNYGYASNKLALYEFHYFDSPAEKTILEKEEYTYDSLGRVAEANIFYGYENTVSKSLYKHGYTPEGKLLWMVRYEMPNTSDRWLMGDSTVINYRNGEADTSYGYISSNGTTWNNWPSLRYVFNTNFTGINPNTQHHLSFEVYPNPTRSTLNIQLNNNATIKQVTVSDLLGRTLLVSTTSNPIYLENIKPGTYFVVVETDEGKGTKKIIITE